MKKAVKPVKEPVNIPLVKSMVGESNFNTAVKQELYAGAEPQEAPELVARRIAREQNKI
jgi:hypothetical protein